MNIDELSNNLYEDLGPTVTSLALTQRGIAIGLESDDWNQSGHRRSFLLSCSNIAENNLKLGSIDCIGLKTEHCTLLQHQSDQAELYFSSSPKDPLKVMDTLRVLNKNIFQSWRSETSYICTNANMLSEGHGIIARGPEQVLNEYLNELKEDLKCSLIKTHSLSGKFILLFLSADNFVICEEVECIEL